MERRNIASVSWSDHLCFGQGDGKLHTIESLQRRMEKWRDELGAGIIHWRCLRDRIEGRYYSAKGHRNIFQAGRPKIDWNDFEVVPKLAWELGMKVYLYVSIFDEGWPLAPKEIRNQSYHSLHWQYVGWQSNFSKKYPEYTMVDRTGKIRQWGVLCLAYPEVREHLIQRFCNLLKLGDFDGLFVCLRSQSRPADFADQFGFNEPIRRDYLNRYGRDILKEDFDLSLWRDLLGEYLTCFLAELRSALNQGTLLSVGVPRGKVVGPPLGNATLQWPKWVQGGIIDQLIINQNSSCCPSMWHQLWPMHRGYGYIQNYLDGFNMLPLHEDLTSNYGPVFEGSGVQLYVARQWDERSEAEEETLLSHPAVDGLVFSTFRFDNPGPITRGNWVA
jgi:hypothetical protein